MTDPHQPAVDLHLRSYGAREAPDRHPFAQLVLPVAGEVLLEIEGRAGRLDPLHGAVVAAGAWHTQCAPDGNRSFVVDVDEALLAGPRARLLERPFAPLAPAARKLVEFMTMMTAHRSAPSHVVAGWVPLLLDTLAAGAAAPALQPMSRLAALRARIEAEPGLPWTTAAMARAAGVSVSRLHALFRSELDSSPHAWLLQLRLDRACTALAGGHRPIAEVALDAGFSDQSALTRAMRDTLGVTPGAYRRGAQETASTSR